MVVDRMQILPIPCTKDVAMATIFDFLYIGCTLAPPEEYD